MGRRNGDPNTPDTCPRCKHTAWHEVKTRINTPEEASTCTVPGCSCYQLADDIPPSDWPPGIVRRNHQWDYA